MSTATPAIDLSRLPPPDVIQQLSFKELLTATLTRLKGMIPDYVESEADPIYIGFEAAMYERLHDLQRVNDAARAVMLPYSRRADLDNIAALLGVERQIVTPADPDAVPPVEAVYESDERLRLRAQIALSAVSTAGPASSWRFHALGASADVLDAAAVSPGPGLVTVTVLSREGNGVARQNLLDVVAAALNDESVRPLGDVLTVRSAAIVEYSVSAELTLGSGPDAAAVLADAREAVTAYVASVRRIGLDVPLSALYAALHRPGVTAVDLTSPAADIAVNDAQASYATAVNVTEAGG